MKRFKKTKAFCIFVLFVILAGGFGSCSKKVYPSGIEGNLLVKQQNYRQDERRRERLSRKANREHSRLERKASKPLLKAKKKAKKEQKRLIRNHIAKQHPDVQARMKANEKFTRRNNPPTKSFVQKIKFWKNNSHKHGTR